MPVPSSGGGGVFSLYAIGSGAAGAAGLYAMGAGVCCCTGEAVLPVAGVGGPGSDCTEFAVSVLGGNWAPTAVLSSCCTTGLMLSLCSAGVELGLRLAGASLMSSFSAGSTALRCPKNVAASFSVQR